MNELSSHEKIGLFAPIVEIQNENVLLNEEDEWKNCKKCDIPYSDSHDCQLSLNLNVNDIKNLVSSLDHKISNLSTKIDKNINDLSRKVETYFNNISYDIKSLNIKNFCKVAEININ